MWDDITTYLFYSDKDFNAIETFVQILNKRKHQKKVTKGLYIQEIHLAKNQDGGRQHSLD